MSEFFVRACPWIRDALLAYAGGLAVGAPIAAVAAWSTGSERLTTAVLLAVMVVLLVSRRRPRALRARRTSDGHPTTRTLAPRRVA